MSVEHSGFRGASESGHVNDVSGQVIGQINDLASQVTCLSLHTCHSRTTSRDWHSVGGNVIPNTKLLVAGILVQSPASTSNFDVCM